MANRRQVMAGLCGVWMGAAWPAGALELGRSGGFLLPAHNPGPASVEAWEELARAGTPKGPWVQILRTFGDPVLEGHFAIRAHLPSGRLCLAMWDLGDRVLGLGQFADQPGAEMWDLVKTVMSRKPVVAIGNPSLIYKTDHFEAAHWRLGADEAARFGRETEAESAVGRLWEVPSRDVASAISPLTRGLLPPEEGSPSHVLWHEPEPLVAPFQGDPQVYRLGEGIPGLDDAVASSLRSGRMLTPIDGGAAQALLDRSGGPGMVPVASPSGIPLGRVRVLTM